VIRSFIAVEISDEIRSAIGEVQARLKRASRDSGMKVSWTKVENLHLTLQFLGYVEELAIPKISTALDAITTQHTAFEVVVRGAGAFPDERRPRVLWVGCEDAGARSGLLAKAVQGAMEPLGFQPEHREFSAHLTLGRVKNPHPDAALTRALDSIKNEAFGTLRVEAIHLIQSQLHPEGSIYTKLSSHILGGT